MLSIAGVPAQPPAYHVLSIAGGGSVADGPAADAGFNNPRGLALTIPGNHLIIADQVNHRIRVWNRGLTAITVHNVVIDPDEVRTIAGTGEAGFTGDGLPAIDARIQSPLVVAHDDAGNTYFDNGHRIRQVDVNGTISTLTGTGVAGVTGDGSPAAGAQIHRPTGLVVWENGTDKLLMFTQPNRIRAINLGAATTLFLGVTINPGDIHTILGDGTASDSPNGTDIAMANMGAGSQVNSPRSLAIDAQNNLYFTSFRLIFASNARQLIRVINLSGAAVTFYPTAVAGQGPTVGVHKIWTIAGDGSQFTDAAVTDPVTFALESVKPGGALATLLFANGFDMSAGWPGGGALFYTEPFKSLSAIRRIDGSNGQVTTISGGSGSGFEGDGVPANLGVWSLPDGLRVDRSVDDVYIADRQNNILRRITLGLLLNTVAGTGFGGASGDDALAYTASLSRVNSIRFGLDPINSNQPAFFVADQGNKRVFKVDNNGNLTRIAGDGLTGIADGTVYSPPACTSASATRLQAPSDVALQGPNGPAGGDGNLYVSGGPQVRYLNRTNTAVQIGSETVPACESRVVVGDISNPGTDASQDGGVPQLAVRLGITESVETVTVGGLEVLLIVERFSERLRVFNPHNASVSILGIVVDAQEVRVAPLSVTPGISPRKIRVDALNNRVWISDFFNNRLLAVDLTTGNLVFNIATTPIFTRPRGLAVGPQGEVYVSSNTAHRIYHLDPTTSLFTAIAGNGVSAFGGDGGLALDASFSFISGLDVEVVNAAASPPDINIYVADLQNNRARKLEQADFPVGTLNGPITVTPIPGVSLTFNGTVTVPGPSPGYVSVIPSLTGPAPPPGFRVGQDGTSVYFDITAVNFTFTGSVTMCINWAGEFDASPPPVVLQRYNGSTWECLAPPTATCPADFPTATTSSGNTTQFSLFKAFQIDEAVDQDCDTVLDVLDQCPGGDDTVDNDGDNLPDCAFFPGIDNLITAWTCGEQGEKVQICHFPPDNPANSHTICVSPNAVAEHLAHGDYLGPCDHVSCTSLRQRGDPLIANLTNAPPQIRVALPEAPTQLHLYPNPFSNSTTLEYNLPVASKVEITIFDPHGHIVHTFLGKRRQAGNYKHSWDGSDRRGELLPGGVYWLRFRSNTATIVSKVLLIR